jgi:hypothetical protein
MLPKVTPVAVNVAVTQSIHPATSRSARSRRDRATPDGEQPQELANFSMKASTPGRPPPATTLRPP